MSVLQGKNIDGFTQIASNYDPKPNRRISDNFTSSRSYTPDHHTQTAYITQHRLCENLRKEVNRERIKVSIACKDLVRYITDHQSNDALVVGFQSPKDNPFRDNQQCSLL